VTWKSDYLEIVGRIIDTKNGLRIHLVSCKFFFFVSTVAILSRVFQCCSYIGKDQRTERTLKTIPVSLVKILVVTDEYQGLERLRKASQVSESK